MTQEEEELRPRADDARIAALGDWRGETLARLRALIRDADPECGGGEMAQAVQPAGPVGSMTASLHRRDLQGQGEADLRQGRRAEDPSGLFNSSLDGDTRRAIDLREGDGIDAARSGRSSARLQRSLLVSARPQL